VNPRTRSSATWLALAYALLVVYASLYPFAGWQGPGAGQSPLWWLPPAVHQSAFDRWSNGLGYAPLGLLLTLAMLRSRVRPLLALPAAAIAGALLSYSLELVQQFVPPRVPTREDFLLNATGAAGGALAALALHATGWVDRWQRLRARWVRRDAGDALALLALWPVALLFPSAAPLGLGPPGDRLRQTLAGWLDGVPWAEPAHQLLALSASTPGPASPGPLAEVSTTALGLLVPCLVAFAVAPPGWRRAGLALGAAALGVAAMTLSTALNFGPQQALAWIGPRTGVALSLGLVLALACVGLGARLVIALGLVACTALLAAALHAPADPYLAASLQQWEQGRFVRFHGLAQWLGWLWPLLALAWLLAQMGRRG
jgi:VanZ family protein